MSNPVDTRFRRLRKKGSRDFSLACKIIDAARICHVGITLDKQPYVIPMALARDHKTVLLHGSVASRLTKSMAAGLPCCVTVTLLDGLVLARSAFNSSMNYRCVMIFGQASIVSDPPEKQRGLQILTDHLMPERRSEIRPSTISELNATTLLSLPMETFTVKISNSPPDDPAKDLDSPVWAGVIPLHTMAGKPEAAPDLKIPYPVPGYVKRWSFD